MKIFEKMESNVRTYCRSFPDVFNKAKGSLLFSESGKKFVDFLAGAGALNYGHNNEFIKQRISAYLASDSIVHGLDFYTSAKKEFLDRFAKTILKPRGLGYKVQFTGPTGTNAIEAALKLARKIKKRPGIFAFMGGYHGMTLGALSASGNIANREAAGITLPQTTFMPYPYGFMSSFDTIEYMDFILNDSHSGIEKPAAILFETVQAEGGVIVAPVEWIKQLRNLCDRHDILLICDDIQVGCHRTRSFFSFERATITPDIVVLSKSISGYGLPMSLVLMKPELDVWKPGEHNGTFRGHQLAFVGATAAMEYIEHSDLETKILTRELFLKNFINNEIAPISDDIHVRGIGMIWGIDLSDFGGAKFAKRIADHCYTSGLIVERAGRHGTVVKIMPPLNIEIELLEEGCTTMKQAFMHCT